MSRKTTGPATTRRRVAVGTALLSATALFGSGLALAADTDPAITALDVTTGPASGGSGVVTISGTSLDKVTKVWFGSTAASSFTVEDGKLRVTPPTHAAGKVDVTFGSSAGSATTATTDDYTYSKAPSVTGVALSTDKKSLEITGEQLTGATAVLFGDVVTKLVPGTDKKAGDTITATKITLLKAPALKVGAVNVGVVSPNGIGYKDAGWGSAPTASKLYTPGVDAKGKETKVNVTTLDALGGTSFFIEGSAFTGTTEVTVGSAKAAFAVVSDTVLRVVAPKSADAVPADSKTPNTIKVDVTVKNAFGTAAKPVKVTYANLPTVTAVSTTVGWATAATNTVTITGTNLKGAKVAFGKVAGKLDAKASNTATSQTFIVGKATADTKGDILVVTDGGSTYVLNADKTKVQYTWQATKPAKDVAWTKPTPSAVPSASASASPSAAAEATVAPTTEPTVAPTTAAPEAPADGGNG